jgi:flavodoxin
MKALVIYDSIFGNTEQVARAISGTLGTESTAIRVTNAVNDRLSGLSLLIVGSPKRAFRPTKPISQFLDGLPWGALKGVRVAAFDTRMPMDKLNSPMLGFMVRMFGFVSKPIAEKLVRKGGELTAPPEGFIVEESEGPLRRGELERAATWARHVAEAR